MQYNHCNNGTEAGIVAAAGLQFPGAPGAPADHWWDGSPNPATGALERARVDAAHTGSGSRGQCGVPMSI